MYSRRSKSIAVLLVMAMIAILCVMCTGQAAKDDDWFGPDATEPSNTDDIYHAAGNVGIGTDDPATDLDVHGDVTVRGYVYSGTPGLGTSQPLRLYAAGPINFLSGYYGTYTGDAFYWYIDAEDNPHLKMIMTKGGDLGIGLGIDDLTPDAKLEVDGSVALATDHQNAVWIGGDPIPTENADLRILHQGYSYCFAAGSHDGDTDYFTIAPLTNQARATVNINDVLHLTPRSAAPTVPPPQEGDIYVDSSTDPHHIFCYLSGVWKQLD